MNPPESALSRAARWLTFGSAASILFSIAASQILLALAVAALLLSGDKLRLPRIQWPLALFMLGTLVSLAFSGDPLVDGLPQVRKFFVFLELLVVFSCLRNLKVVRWLFLTWAGIGAITALRGCVQFTGKVQEAHRLGLPFTPTTTCNGSPDSPATGTRTPPRRCSRSSWWPRFLCLRRAPAAIGSGPCVER